MSSELICALPNEPTCLFASLSSAGVGIEDKFPKFEIKDKTGATVLTGTLDDIAGGDYSLTIVAPADPGQYVGNIVWYDDEDCTILTPGAQRESFCLDIKDETPTTGGDGKPYILVKHGIVGVLEPCVFVIPPEDAGDGDGDGG